VTEGLAVVAADGLVGRVTAVAPWTSDVVLVGSPDLVAAVRVGRDGTLGSVSVGPSTDAPAGRAALSLELVERGRAGTGDLVTTLGGTAAGALPAGLRVGTVSALATPAGSLTARGTVRPSVDRSTLDVVGVLLPVRRTTPRPAVTGGAG
jgi:rod shape-determining protein MreC